MDFVGTLWAIVPPLVAIILAFITKEVYISLFTGCLLGGLFLAKFHPWETFTTIVDSTVNNIDMNIIIFDVLLGMIIVLLARSGASKAYGAWASRRIKSKRGSMIATSVLGVLIFVDDYFNCLTVGNVMRPVTDKHKVSRAKLAYLIDSTAAPVCIIAPISSWAAAVSSYVPQEYDVNGFQLFLNAIPYNLYAILTLVMVFFTSAMLLDFGKMKQHEINAANGDLFTTGDEFKEMSESELQGSDKGRVTDLLVPIFVLIGTAVFGMIYTGYLNGGANVVDAFANCNASLSLVFATFVTLVVMLFMYVPRKIVKFQDFMGSLVEGFKLMVPALLVLTLAWTLKGLVDQLDVAAFVTGIFGQGAAFNAFMPLAMFAISIFLGFSTGTSWGTMGIMIPIAVPMCYNAPTTMVICVAAIMAGCVCGDHVSPISDTTIMSSTGAQSNHINHVQTQMQYAAVVVAVCVVGYIISGLTQSWLISLPVSIVILLAVLLFINAKEKRKGAVVNEAD
ncbi:Malate-2H(+)/Na(+)-lactate antiporter [uncultured Roseburia sp.]|uniref:Na+/H+ antiporter NhaC family protein n=1 Tax=Brotonthovivens ammoniilytica TaxID=2981725 RepID=A0ABT2TFC5_9FIRM|nr:Na+/H+ antiporter NhaC family protein [Brotonthovivens ammoniilytica]MCU6760882.1 Na+/H+ antiporter NhaC family protein [Brotonthovivens ammoniilytica]SCI12152.1 Malate-2H(+)/Na(+)-lactate antiporter [uncultured Roseburia sp.]